jgi:hypothetical protein
MKEMAAYLAKPDAAKDITDFVISSKEKSK